MKYWHIVENKKQAILHLSLFIIAITTPIFLGITLGVSIGVQSGLIIVTIILSAVAYIKQFKSTIEQSVEQLPRIKTESYIIKPIVFDLKTWGDPFVTLQFKLYGLDNGEPFPADMEAFLGSILRIQKKNSTMLGT